MLEERPRLEEALRAVFGREDLTGRLLTSEHAGGKWTLRYPTASGQTGRIDVDINYMYRVPLWPITAMDSHRVGPWRATGVPVVDVHELAAGKLAALLSRHRARDLFARTAASAAGLPANTWRRSPLTAFRETCWTATSARISSTQRMSGPMTSTGISALGSRHCSMRSGS